MPVSHVFFDLHGTLIDSINSLPPQYALALGRVMAERYGGDPTEWTEANLRIFEDWESYYADLDFGADDGLDQRWEGETRTTRALFRLTGRTYPTQDELDDLFSDMHFSITSQCDALFPDARAGLSALHQSGAYTLGLVSHAFRGHAEGLLVGAGVSEWFDGPIITPEDVGQFEKDAQFYQTALTVAALDPAAVLLVEDDMRSARAAASLGMHVALVDRAGRYTRFPWAAVLPDLTGLAGLLANLE